MCNSKYIALLLSKKSIAIWISLLCYASSVRKCSKSPSALWLSGSINTTENFTKLYYDEGDVLTLTCYVGHDKDDKSKCKYGDNTSWTIQDGNGKEQNVAGVPDRGRPCASKNSYSEYVKLAITKEYDNWLLQCTHYISYLDNRKKYSSMRCGRIAVRLLMRQDDTRKGDSATGSSQKPKGDYMSLTGAVNYSYDPTTNNSVQHYFTENEWLNVTCKLMYPDDLSHMYDGRYMWWELEDQNGTVRNKTTQNKITDQLNSYAINLILAEKYDKWSLSCRHAEVEGGRLNEAAKLGTVKIILHAKKKQSISTTTTTSTEAPAKSDEYEHEENDSPPEEETSVVIIATAAVLVTLTIILAVVLAYYICKKNHKPKQDDNLPSAYADLNFVNRSDNIIRSSEPNSLYSEIVFENDEVGYATVLDKKTDVINIEESPYAEVNPYIQVSFANNSRQQIRDLYAKVLPKSQRNKKIEKNPSNGKDLYATVVPKSERKRIFAKGEADDVSKNDKIQMGTAKDEMNCSTYANTSKDCDLYASIEPYNANKTYANVNIKSAGKDDAVQYVNCDVENKAECNYANSNFEQKTRDCTRDTSKDNNNCNQVYFNERKKLITG